MKPPVDENKSSARRARWPAIVAASLAAFLTAAFLAPWWRSFLGLSLDGYFPYYGHLILEGRIPYRDFFLHLPPLHPLLDAAIELCCGPSLLAARAVGALGRIALAVVLVLWLGRPFRYGPALFGSLAAVILATGDDTEILDLYNFHALLTAALAGWALSRGLEPGCRRPWLAYGLAGLCAGLACGLKQTIGLNTTLAIVSTPCVLALRSPVDRAALGRRLAWLGGGWLLPLLPIVAWLAANDAFRLFLYQTFVDAGASKGSPWKLLVRPWLDPLAIADLQRAAWLAIACIALLAIGYGLPRPQRENGGEPADGRKDGGRCWPGLTAAALVVAAILVASHVWLHPLADQKALDLRELQRLGVFLVNYGVLLPTLWLVGRALRHPLDALERQWLLLFLVAGGTASALAFSWPAGEALAYPGLAAVAIWAFRGRPRFHFAAALRAPLLAAMVAAVFAAATFKLITPFDFAGWREPSPEDAIHRSAAPALDGILLGAKTLEAVDGTLGIIQRAARPGEPIFVFPDMPIFYWLANRPMPTFAALSWFDVTPDRVVDADLARLRANPPVVIVYHEISGGLMDVNEKYFRGAKESGLRRMQAALIEMAPGYRLAGFYEPWKRLSPLQVWVRNDRADELGIEE
jgi:hypothetical protein